MMTTILSLNDASNLALKPSFGAQDNNLRNDNKATKQGVVWMENINQ